MTPAALVAQAAARGALYTLLIECVWSLPALTVPLAIGLAACRPRAVRWMALACLLLLSGLGGCVALRIDLPTPDANLVAAAVAVVVYHLLAATSWTVRPWWLRLVAMSVAYAPILAAWGAFLLYRTVLLLVLMFLVAEYTTPPVEQAELPGGLFCQRRIWGAAFTDEGYTVHLYDHPLGLPFLRREVLGVTVDESRPGTGPEQASCRSAFADYKLRRPADATGSR